MTVKQYDIVLNYDTSKADASLASFRAGVIRSFQELSSKTASIEVFKDLGADAKKSQQAISELGVRAAELRRILGAMASGDTGVKRLAADLKQGAAQMTELERSAARGEKSLAALAVRERELQERADSAAASVGKIRAELAGLSGQDPAFKKISSEVASAERDLVKAQAAVAKNTEQFRLMQAAVQASYAKVAELRSAFNGLESGDAAFKRISAALQLAEKDLAANQAKVIGNRIAFNELRDVVAAAEQRVSGLREKLSGLSAGDPAFKSLSASAKAAERELASAEKALSAVREKSRSLSEVIEQTRAKMDSLRQTQLTLVDALKKSEQGVAGYKLLQDNLRAVEVELKKTERQFATQTAQLERLDGELRAAGVDTKNLAAEQAALAKALEASQRAIAAQAARQTLGVVSTDEARAQIAKLREAYDVLRASGTASINELQLAKARLNQKIQEVEASMSGLSGTTGSFNLRMLALAASSGLVGTSLTAAAKAAIDYEQGIARISSITNLNTRQLDEMGRAVLALTQKIGLDLPTALKATYEIISSGIPAGNALDVLESSARAAIAGVTDVSTAARIGVAALNAYGLQVGQLDRVYDILFQTVKDGVITFPELSEKLGLVLPAAKNAGLSLEDVSAAVVVLTRAGFNAPRAMVALEGAIKQLAAPTDEAAAAMLQLDIRYNGFIGTVEQIAKKNLGPETLRRLIPDVEGQRAIATLAQNFGLLKRQVDEVTQSSGAAKEAFDKLANTPEQEIKKFTAAVDALKVAVGEQLTRALGVVLPSITAFVTSLADGERKVGAMSAALGLFAPTLVQSARAAQDAAVFADVLGPALSRAGVEAGKAQLPVGGLSDRYLVLKAATESAVAAAVASANGLGAVLGPSIAKVEQQLALLDARIVANTSSLEQLQKRVAASGDALKALFEQQSAAAASALQQQLLQIEKSVAAREIGELESIKRLEAARAKNYADQLVALQVYQQKALLAFDQEAAAKRAIAEKNGADLKKIDIELREARLALLNGFREKYASLINSLQGDELRLVSAVRDAEEEKRRLRESAANFVRELRRTEFGEEIRQLKGQLSEANEYRQKAEQATNDGLLARAQEYLQKAFDLEKSVAARAAQIKVEEEKKARDEIQAQYYRSEDERIKHATESADKIAKANRLSTDAAAVLRSSLTDMAATEKALEAAIDSRSEVQKKAATSFSEISKSGQEALSSLRQEIEKFSATQAGEVTLRLVADSKQVDAAVSELASLVQQRGVVAEVKLKTDAAKLDIQDLVDAIEKKRPQVEIQAKLDKLRADVEAAEAGLPKLGIETDTTAVDNAFAAIGNSIETLGKKKFELQNNLDEISRKLNDLNEVKTRSVHTIELRYEDTRGNPAAAPAGAVPAPAKFASGGLVSFDGIKAMASARRYASGGFVGAVPGVGNRDTEFRMLASGSFVLRKDAVRALVEQRSLGGRLANGVAGGIADGSIAGLIEAVNAASVFSRSVPMGAMFDGAFRAQDASIKALRAKFPLGYVEPGAEAFSRSLAQPRVDAVRVEYERARGSGNATAADAATKNAIAIAEGIATPARGLSYEDLKAFAEARAADQAEAKARGEAQKAGMSFEAYLEYIDKLQKEEAAKKAAQNGAQPPAQQRASGGSVSGGALIPALLTPGEMVFGPQAVRSIGLPTLEALNAMRFNAGGLVPGALAGLVSVPPPGIQAMTENLARFNLGGSVTNNSASTSNTNINGGVSVTINAGGTTDARQLARGLVDELNNIARRRK